MKIGYVPVLGQADDTETYFGGMTQNQLIMIAGGSAALLLLLALMKRKRRKRKAAPASAPAPRSASSQPPGISITKVSS